MGVLTNSWGGEREHGFTLVELLVVLGIISALIGILMPALSAARNESRALKCLSNIRQLGEALSMYAGDFNSKYPMNTTTPAPGMSWYDSARIGMYLPVPSQGTSSAIYVCPDDSGYLSYAMNFWASSAVDSFDLTPSTKNALWRATVSDSPQMILMIESWSSTGSNSLGWAAPSFVGLKGSTEGAKFGAGSGVPTYRAGWVGLVNCELPYMRHRNFNGPGNGTQARGRVTIAFADGHAELCTNDGLANYSTGLSNNYACWYAGDPP